MERSVSKIFLFSIKKGDPKGNPYVWVGYIVILLLFGLFLSYSNIVGKEVVSCLRDCSTSENNGRFIKIISLNMLHDYPNFSFLSERTSFIASEIKRLDADIVLLQEVPYLRQGGHMALILAERTEMNYAYVRANGNQKLIGFEEGMLILSRFPLKEVAFEELSSPLSFFEHRVVLHAVAETLQGDLDLYVTHLTNNMSANKAQTDRLLSYVRQTAGQTAVIAGDFNAPEQSAQIQMLRQNWVDSFQMVHPTAAGYTCCQDRLLEGTPAAFNKNIDYIFFWAITKELSIQDVALVFERPFVTPKGRVWASDHLGLLLTLQLPAPP